MLLQARRFPARFPCSGPGDLAPTLLSLLGVAPPVCFVGHILDGRAQTPVVLNDGSAVADDRLYVAGGPAIPDGGACFTWPSVRRDLSRTVPTSIAMVPKSLGLRAS